MRATENMLGPSNGKEAQLTHKMKKKKRTEETEAIESEKTMNKYIERQSKAQNVYGIVQIRHTKSVSKNNSNRCDTEEERRQHGK